MLIDDISGFLATDVFKQKARKYVADMLWRIKDIGALRGDMNLKNHWSNHVYDLNAIDLKFIYLLSFDLDFLDLLKDAVADSNSDVEIRDILDSLRLLLGEYANDWADLDVNKNEVYLFITFDISYDYLKFNANFLNDACMCLDVCKKVSVVQYEYDLKGRIQFYAINILKYVNQDIRQNVNFYREVVKYDYNYLMNNNTIAVRDKSIFRNAYGNYKKKLSELKKYPKSDEYGYFIEHSPLYFLQNNIANLDLDSIEMALRINGMDIQYLAMENNESLFKIAVQQNGEALQFASAKLKNNFDLVLAAVKQNRDALKYSSEKLKQDQTLINAADKTKEKGNSKLIKLAANGKKARLPF